MKKRPKTATTARVMAAAMVPKVSPVAPELVDGLTRVINPEARDRWVAPSIRHYTPERVEQVLKSAATGDLTAVWEMFDLMEETWPRLAKNLNELKDAVCDLEWNVQPWSGKSQQPTPEAQRRADLVEDLVWRMDPSEVDDENDFEDTLRQILDAWGKGVAVLEIDWAPVETEYGSAIAPKATRWVHPKYYGYPNIGADRLMLCSRELTLNRSALSTESQFTPFPPDKFLIGVHKAKSGHPSRAALLRPLAFWWAASNFTAEWFLNFAQIFGMPVRLAYYDRQASAGTIANIQEMLRCMGSAAWAAFPAGTQFELKEAAKGAGSDNPQRAILEFADRVCDLLILRQTLTTDAGDRGTQALGTVHQNVRADVIMAAANFAARVVNRQLIRPICRLNYGDDRECPWLQPCQKKVVDLAAETGRIKTALSIPGFRVGKSWAHEHLEIPMPGPEDESYEGASMSPFAFGPGGPAGPGPSQDQIPGEDNPAEEEPVQARGMKACCGGVANRVQGKATDQLIERALEDLTGVQARWLGGLKPWFETLIRAAEGMTDEQWARNGEAFLIRAQAEFPELFGKMDRQALANALEATLGAAVVNGAVEGAMKRRAAR